MEGVTYRGSGRRTFGPISLRVGSGQIVGLLGPNGAGKTSLFRTIAGGWKLLAGEISSLQNKITHLSRARRERVGVFVCLPEQRRLRANRSMLEIVGAAIAREPRVLVVDEPFNGLSGTLPRRAMLAFLRECRDAGCGLLIADHDIRAALQIVDRAYLIHRGEIIAEGSPNYLIGQQGTGPNAE